MSEAIWKAYEELKKEINKHLEVPEDKFDTFILYNIDNAIIVLNLIKKQQKKIDELKKYEKYYEEMEEVNKKFISVDKIKNKIEEVKSSKENHTFTLTSEDIRRTIITNLQELLEEE